MKKTAITLIILLSFVIGLNAQVENVSSLDAILAEIGNNNPTLKVLRQHNEASIAEAKAENAIGETAIEYTPFYQSMVPGVASSELIVSQQFDFPTVYAQRKRQISSYNDVRNNEFQIQRLEIIGQAEQLCNRYWTARETKQLLNQRMQTAQHLLDIYNKRVDNGDATIIELNRIKMDCMSLQREIIANEGELEAAALALKGMNGGTEIDAQALRTLTFNDIISIEEPIQNAKIVLAKAELSAYEQDMKLSKQAWLPKLTLGYRRNTELHEANNGVLVGVAVPLFGSQTKIKAARLKLKAAEMRLNEISNQSTSKLEMLQAEAKNMTQQLAVFDTAQLQQSISTMLKAVEAGEMTVTDYYVEAERIYSAMTERIGISSKLHGIQTELRWGF